MPFLGWLVTDQIKALERQLQFVIPIILGDGWRALRLLLTEPLGLLIPLALLAVVFEAPQMRDMFDAMVGIGHDGAISTEAWHWLGYPVAALVLTFVSWFWTRAALTEAASFPARLALRRACRWGWRKFRQPLKTSGRAWSLWGDAGWLARTRVAPETQNARRLAGRIPPLLCLAVLAAPIVVAPDSLAAYFGLSFAGLVYLFISKRHAAPRREFRGWRGWGVIAALAVLTAACVAVLFWDPAWLTPRRNVAVTIVAAVAMFAILALLLDKLREPSKRITTTPCWMWWTRTSGLFASAPYGWPAALVLFLISVGYAAILAWRPEWPEGNLHTATTVVISVAAGTTILAIVTAIVRDLMWALVVAFLVAGWVMRTVLPMLAPRLTGLVRERLAAPSRSVLRRATDGLSAAVLVGWLTFVPFEAGAPTRHALRLATPIDTAAEGLCQPPSQGKLARPCFSQAVQAFAARMQTHNPSAAAYPAIIVASEGGASRAAVWTLSAFQFLDAATANMFGPNVFAISAVSGGSLGAVTYLQALHHEGTPAGGLDWPKSKAREGLKQLANGDLLNVAAGTLFLNDLLARLSPWAAERLGVPDRGLALERTFERHWKWDAGFDIPAVDAKGGLIRLYQDKASPAFGTLPELFLNGTDVATGRRIITSSVHFEPNDFPTSDDLLSLTGADVPAATAVLNSARFPFISPPARFVIGDGGGDRSGKTAQLFDGGVFDNYGARTAMEIAAAVARISRKDKLRLVPIVVVVSNDADSARGADETDNGEPVPALRSSAISCDWVPATNEAKGRDKVERKRNEKATLIPETLAIVLGLNNVRGAHGLDALHWLRLQFCALDEGENGIPPKRMFHIALPRVLDRAKEAAPMNWTQGPKAAQLLLVNGLEAPFNEAQATELNALLVALQAPPRSAEARTEQAQVAFPPVN